MHLFSLFVFTGHGAGKGFDRFYAWSDALFHLKKKDFMPFFNLYLYIVLNVIIYKRTIGSVCNESIIT
ncbi:hypothetical protein COM13_05340 [Bacillus pseudomycoides]|nr:hypothetical protein BLX05_13575 [Bacillus pseudomycoides]PDY00126.1 hypothetical protein COO07_13060 [Bacillus pseudomycoides]PDY10434.1 hypothetical protein COO16_21030 [Bacillus pseudomycoides]PEE04489.1 hypothetical protein CON86_20095 [Bacillus pseudomycoides]PEK74608.1 hypothetical protein CN597_24700 [Bacillus pseudomycoides]